jgi:hypothetical protein
MASRHAKSAVQQIAQRLDRDVTGSKVTVDLHTPMFGLMPHRPGMALFYSPRLIRHGLFYYRFGVKISGIA